MGGHMSTMDEFKYFANNSGLCGVQIHITCPEDIPPPSEGREEAEDDEQLSWIFWVGTWIAHSQSSFPFIASSSDLILVVFMIFLQEKLIRFRKRGKLGPRFIGPFEIVARVGKVAYRLELPPELSQIHDTFHVSQLRKCLADDSAFVPLEDIEVDERLNYAEKPIVVLERKTKTLRNKEIGIVKVQWEHRKGSEWTWDPEDEMQRNHPELFQA
ncbi:hypothetical protein OSB04_010576 [Centaurea solstitialis]|uniref:Tf2-1-like SH3-like domain-containing protein n=1 Tax=Centaurea solstitialis TaxID=347529 RepID=A0AA38WCY9_9ASTR|nr:hypothetical protein OSB04_010576 [Centaurea solstitialis]